MKLRWLFSLILVLAAAAANISAQKKGFIGYEHKGVVYGATLPNGAKDLGGGLLSIESYGVSRFSKGGDFMLWLEKIIAYDAEDVPTWQVRDVLTFPKLKTNQEFLLSYGSTCERHGKESLDLVVLAEFSPKRKTYKINSAWMANVEKEKFEKISVKGIKCSVAVEP